MARIKKLTPEEIEMKNALKLRAFSLYQEQRKLRKDMKNLDDRIEHLERQISNVGGPGIDFSEVFKQK